MLIASKLAPTRHKKTDHKVGFLVLDNYRGGIGRSDWIRTSDLLVPNETRYQAALRSEDGAHSTEKVLLHKVLGGFFLGAASLLRAASGTIDLRGR